MNSGAMVEEAATNANASAALESSVSSTKAAKEAAATAAAMNVVVKKTANLGIPSKASIVMHRKERVEEGSFVDKLHGFFEHRIVEIILNSLLVLDVLIIFAELFIMTEYPKCYIIERDCIACCPVGVAEGDEGVERYLAGGGQSSEYGFCDVGYEDGAGTASCDDYEHQKPMTIKNVLFWITVGILTVFLLEGIVEMLALGKVYFKQGFMVLDFVIVFVSLTLEMFFHFWSQRDGFEYDKAIGMLVLIRLWRFVRIGHGFFEVSSEATSKAYEPLFAYIEKLESALEHRNIPIPGPSDKVRELIDGNKQHGGGHGVPHHHH